MGFERELSEDGTQVLDGFELIVGALVGGVVNRVSEGMEAMKQPILWCDGGYGHCGVPEVNGVGDNYHAGVAFEESVTPVVGECLANIESVIVPEVPGAPC